MAPSISKKLSGNKAHPALDANGKVSAHHVMVYTADDIWSHPEVRLTQGGMILIALLAGGDYNKVRRTRLYLDVTDTLL